MYRHAKVDIGPTWRRITTKAAPAANINDEDIYKLVQWWWLLLNFSFLVLKRMNMYYNP